MSACVTMDIPELLVSYQTQGVEQQDERISC